MNNSVYPTPDDRFWLGGAKVGSRDICFACAEMTVTDDRLELRLADHTRYFFSPQQVPKLEFWDCGPAFPAAGIRFHHQIPEYPSEIVFWFNATSAAPFVEKLNESGFGRKN
jgi:hypothetical protein